MWLVTESHIYIHLFPFSLYINSTYVLAANEDDSYSTMSTSVIKYCIPKRQSVALIYRGSNQVPTLHMEEMLENISSVLLKGFKRRLNQACIAAV